MKKRHIIKAISLMMTLAMLLGVIVAMPITANAAGDVAEQSDTKVTGEWDPDNGSYVIDSAAELLAFMNLAQTQTDKFSGKTVYLAEDVCLNADWSPVPTSFNNSSCSYTTPTQAWTAIPEFKGTFDGQGHVISGLFINPSDDGGRGMFQKINGATIQNLKIEDSLISSTGNTLNNAIGLLAGWAEGTNTINNVVIDGYVRGYRAVGGIVGAVSNNAILNMNNCVFIGTVCGVQGVGGLVGAMNSDYLDGKVTMTDCVNAGNVVAYGSAEIAAFVGRIAANAELIRCVNLGSVANFAVLNRKGAGNTNDGELNTSTTTLILTDCYALTGTTITKVQDYFTVTGSVATVANSGALIEKDGYSAWSNTIKGAVPTTVASVYGIPVIKDNEVSVATAREMRYMSGSTSDFSGITVKLTADIDLNPGWTATVDSHTSNNVPVFAWKPIANFKGTLDGQGHTVSGLYIVGSYATDSQYGIFKTASGAMFKNLVIVNSFVASGNQGGTLVGAVKGSACRFENIYIDSIVQAYDSTNTRWYLGGLVGSQTAVGSTYENCVFAGTVTYCRESCAAIVGATGKDCTTTLTNCVNLGTVNATTQSAGLVGRWCGSGTLTNCANLGSSSAVALVTLDSHGDDAQKGTTSDITVVDSYWLANKSAEGLTVNANNNLFTFVTVTINGVSETIEGTANITSESVKVPADKLKIDTAMDVLGKNGFDAWVAYGDAIMPASVAEMLYGIEEVRMVGAQNTEEADGKFNVRFIGGIDNLQYDYVGFDIVLSYGDDVYTLPADDSMTDVVYTSVIADGETVSVTDESLAKFSITHMYVAVVENVPTTGTATVSARAYAVKDGVRIFTGEAYVLAATDGVIAWN